MIDEEELAAVVRFHGHLCPGLAMGLQAANVALREIGPHSKDEEVVAVVETDMCGVDAIQYLTGCTFGKGNLIHLDWGKNAYTFYRRSDGKAIRIAGKVGAWKQPPEQVELFTKMRAGTARPDEEIDFDARQEYNSRRLLEKSPEDLFDVSPVDGTPPRKARIHASVVCEECQEEVMETRIRSLGGRHLCPPCFQSALDGD